MHPLLVLLAFTVAGAGDVPPRLGLLTALSIPGTTAEEEARVGPGRAG